MEQIGLLAFNIASNFFYIFPAFLSFTNTMQRINVIAEAE